MPLRQDFGSFRQPVSPTRELSSILGDLQGQVVQEQKMQMAEQVQKDALAQQAVENARAKEILGMRRGEYDRTMAEKNAADIANSLYMDVTPNKIQTAPEKTTVIPGTPGTEGLITNAELSKSAQIGRAADEAMRLDKLLKGGNTTDSKPISIDTSFLNLPQAEESKTTARYTDPTYKYAANSRMLNDYMKRGSQRSPSIPAKPMGYEEGPVDTQSTIPSMPIELPSKLDLEAERQKQLSKIDELTKEVVSGYKAGAQAPTKETKTVTPAEYKFKAPSREEFNKTLLAQARKDKGGELSKVEKGAIGKRAETLFNRSEDLALKNMELLARQARGTPRETAYDRELGRLRAQKLMGVLDKGNKGYDKVSEFAESMYTMFPDDPNRVAQYIEDNKAELSKMSKQNLAARVAEFKSREGQESSLDVTDWFPTALGGGTKIGDVLDSTR